MTPDSDEQASDLGQRRLVFVCAEDVSAMFCMQELSFWEVSLTGSGLLAWRWLWGSEGTRSCVPGSNWEHMSAHSPAV